MPNVLIQGRIAAPHAPLLRAELDDGWRIDVWDPRTDALDAFAPMAQEADAIIGGNIPTETWPETPRLKLFQIPWTGYDFCSPERIPLGVPVCNCFEHESAIAEYVLLAMLEWQIGLRHMDRRIRTKGWAGRGPGEANYHGEVRGATVGIVGYGHIGHEVAVRARAFGMRAIGVRRRAQEVPPELDWLGTTEDLDRLLAESDFVLIACDLNEATRGLIDEARLARMKPTGVLINIARGAIVDEAALFHALQEKRIGGAVIDVWYNYKRPGEPDPWPSDFPFQDLDNVILSAHESGWTEAQILRRWRFVAENLRRMAEGAPLENIVFVGALVAPGAADRTA